jgi:hypothetical protein
MLHRLLPAITLILCASAHAQVTAPPDELTQCRTQVDTLIQLLAEKNAPAGVQPPAPQYTCRASCMIFSSKPDSNGQWKKRVAVTGKGGQTLKQAYLSVLGSCLRNEQIWAEEEPSLVNLRHGLIRKQDYDDATFLDLSQATEICSHI